MCRKSKLKRSFSKHVTVFLPHLTFYSMFTMYHGIQCDKIRNSVHGKHEICRFKAWSLKETQNLLRMFNFHDFS